MEISIRLAAVLVSALGIISFTFGILAETHKPPAGVPIHGKGVIICKYPKDPTIAFGYLSIVFLFACTFAGWYSLFYPYKGKAIPQSALLREKPFSAFLTLSMGTTGLALAFLLWPVVTQQLHHANNVHHNLETECPTAKTGLLGGGAFISLDSCLFWLVALMLANNAREDYFGETPEESDGEKEKEKEENEGDDNIVEDPYKAL